MKMPTTSANSTATAPLASRHAQADVRNALIAHIAFLVGSGRLNRTEAGCREKAKACVVERGADTDDPERVAAAVEAAPGRCVDRVGDGAIGDLDIARVPPRHAQRTGGIDGSADRK